MDEIVSQISTVSYSSSKWMNESHSYFHVFLQLYNMPCQKLMLYYREYERTRNCSKLRKIHSGQGPISLTINPSEFKFFGQFVLLWLKFSRCQLMSLQLLHITGMTRDPYMLSRHAQNLFWWPENEMRQNEILITLEMCITVMSWWARWRLKSPASWLFA